MTDILTVEKRSLLMSKVKNKDTNIELILRKELFKRGYRFRIKSKLFGRPDIIFPRQKVVIFCDGDFWHGKNFKKEQENYKKFWIEKINTNINRDKLVNRKLKNEGWTILRFWKTEILDDVSKCVNKVEKYLK